MENSPVLDNSNNGNSFKEEKPKRKFNKKILIICSLITILIIAAVYFVISNKYAKMVENHINEELSNLSQEYGDSFNYSLFKCSGFKEITCSTDFIEFYDELQKYSVKNVSFTAAPSLKDLKAVTSGSIEISSVYAENNAESNDIVKLDFNCSDNMTLLSERSLLAHNAVCDSNINDIHSKQISVFYMKDDIFAKHSSMIGVLKEFKDKNIDITSMLLDDMVIESSLNVIESPDLFESIIEISKSFFKAYISENITKEMAVSLYDSLRNDYNQVKNFYGNDEHTSIVDNLIKALDGVIYDNNNSMSMSVILKDKDKIDDMFGSSYINFMLPDYYDINIESSK